MALAGEWTPVVELESINGDEETFVKNQSIIFGRRFELFEIIQIPPYRTYSDFHFNENDHARDRRDLLLEAYKNLIIASEIADRLVNNTAGRSADVASQYSPIDEYSLLGDEIDFGTIQPSEICVARELDILALKNGALENATNVMRFLDSLQLNGNDSTTKQLEPNLPLPTKEAHFSIKYTKSDILPVLHIEGALA